MMQYSAVLVPFWDHCEISRLFTKYYEGRFSLSMLWAPHNHTRPFTYRAVILFNGILTRWDIRTEYIYLYASIFGTFAVIFRALWKVSGSRANIVFCCGLCVLSILAFSPTGHNNHWWSMMTQLTFANVFIGLTLTIIALHHDRWWGHLLSAVAAWLATYTLTNGLVAFGIAALIAQISIPNVLRPKWRTLFWACNLALVLFLYLPGLPENPGSVNMPSIMQIGEFTLAYLGSPLAGLIHFPYKSNFDLPTNTATNAAVGLLVLILMLVSMYRWRSWLTERSSTVLLIVGFASFSLISALLTAYGRATISDGGMNNANASRYTLFGTYLYYALLFWVVHYFNMAQQRVLGLCNWRLASGLLAFIVLLTLSVRTYADSFVVYKSAHDFNKLVSATYIWKDQPTEMDSIVYPDGVGVVEMRAQLRKLRIGPYRFSEPMDNPNDTPLRRLYSTMTAHFSPRFEVNQETGRDILFCHMPSKGVLGESPKSLKIRFGFRPSAYSSPAGITSGAEFSVYGVADDNSTTRVFSRFVDPRNILGDRGELSAAIELNIVFKEIWFEIKPGPSGDINFGHTYWSAVQCDY
jgi:hypothetical protein